MMAFRETYQNIFIANHIKITDDSILFLPVKTTNEIAKNLSKRHNEVKISTVSDNPRNPINRANSKQMKIIEYFNKSKNNKSYFKQEKDGKYTYAYPLYIEKSCLKCHGDRESAPKYIKQNYDSAYGYKLGDLRGIIEVEIAQSRLKNSVDEMLEQKLGSTGLFFIFIVIVLYILSMSTASQDNRFEVSNRTFKIMLLLVFVVLSSIIIFAVNSYKESVAKESLAKTTKVYLRAYETTYMEKKLLSEIFFTGVVKLGKIESRLAKLTDENRDITRTELHEDLKERYAYLKTLGIQQLHIHLPNNESFLRMHKPDEYGDDLTDIRPTVVYVNKYHEPIDGVEEGRLFNGLRFVFPLTYKGSHVGSIELSFGVHSMTKSIMHNHYVLSNFLIKKSVTDRKNFNLNYSPYIKSGHKDYYYDLKVLKELKKVSRKDMKELKPSKKLLTQLNKIGQGDTPSSIYDAKTGNIYTVIPILNAINKENIAFLSIRSKGESLAISTRYATVVALLIIGVLALFFYLINILINKKLELELRVESALKENIKQLQTLQQQSKMAQMGEMIGAIAHQWRQPLNIISTSIQNLKYDYKEGALEDEAFVKSFIDKNKKTIKFMSATIDDFRNFFRLDKEKSDFNVKEMTESVISMQSFQLKSNNISLTISGDEFIFNGFKSEYQQVILNLISNAKDALIENNIQNPTIKIELKNNIITIEDNAGGVSDKVIDRIFEPYFTTKEQGKGTGMGLYMSKMIIEDNMNAELKVTNGSYGAIFSIDFNERK